MDWVAAPFTALGVYLLGSNNIWGWILASIGSVIWCIYAITTNQIPLLLLNLVFFTLDGRGFYNWYKERYNESKTDKSKN